MKGGSSEWVSLFVRTIPSIFSVRFVRTAIYIVRDSYFQQWISNTSTFQNPLSTHKPPSSIITDTKGNKLRHSCLITSLLTRFASGLVSTSIDSARLIIYRARMPTIFGIFSGPAWWMGPGRGHQVKPSVRDDAWKQSRSSHANNHSNRKGSLTYRCPINVGSGSHRIRKIYSNTQKHIERTMLIHLIDPQPLCIITRTIAELRPWAVPPPGPMWIPVIISTAATRILRSPRSRVLVTWSAGTFYHRFVDPFCAPLDVSTPSTCPHSHVASSRMRWHVDPRL